MTTRTFKLARSSRSHITDALTASWQKAFDSRIRAAALTRPVPVRPAPKKRSAPDTAD
jgi:hypothetical protein